MLTHFRVKYPANSPPVRRAKTADAHFPGRRKTTRCCASVAGCRYFDVSSVVVLFLLLPSLVRERRKQKFLRSRSAATISIQLVFRCPGSDKKQERTEFAWSADPGEYRELEKLKIQTILSVVQFIELSSTCAGSVAEPRVWNEVNVCRFYLGRNPVTGAHLQILRP